MYVIAIGSGFMILW